MSKPSGAIDMTQGKPINLMLRFALPMMIGSIFQSLYSMVDSAVLGRFVGSHALAAIGATTSTTGLILLLATGVTSAVSIVLSQYVGANDTDRVRKGIVASGWITLLLGVVLGLISVFAARPLMQLLKTPEDVIDMSVLYIQIVCGCGIAQFAYNAAASILRALGDSKTPLYFLILCSILNVILDLISVIGLNMGVAGVAVATVGSQAISAAICILVMFRKYPDLMPKRHTLRPDMPVSLKIFGMGAIRHGCANGSAKPVSFRRHDGHYARHQRLRLQRRRGVHRRQQRAEPRCDAVQQFLVRLFRLCRAELRREKRRAHQAWRAANLPSCRRSEHFCRCADTHFF